MADVALLSKVDREIRQFGLRSQRDRLMAAQANLAFYRADFARAPVRDRGNTSYDSARFPRHSLIMQRIVDVLTQTLYGEGPIRKLVPPEGVQKGPYERATKWLNACYIRNRMDSLWQYADVLGVVSQVAAFQVGAQEDPEWPVRVQLWDASQFCVWPAQDDPCRPELVAVLDIFDGRNRIRLYSDEWIHTYFTVAAPDSAPMNSPLSQEYRFDSEIPNPYRFLPFSFAYFRMPVCDFWCGSPGNHLRAVNDGINFSMTEGFDCIRYNLRPIVTLKDVRPEWRPPAPVYPGDVWNLSAASDSTREVTKDPTAEYLQADAGFVEAGWQDIQSFIDHTLEMNGVPPSVIRMTQDSVRSGVAIVAEQLPLMQWAKKRQKPFGYYEEELARVVLKVGSLHLGRQDVEEYQTTASDLQIVGEHPGLTLKWPNLYPRIPGQDQDQADDFRLEKKLVSRTMLLMEREGLTREEAEERLEEIAEDLARERELFGDEMTAEAEDAYAVGPRYSENGQDGAEVDEADMETKQGEEQ